MQGNNIPTVESDKHLGKLIGQDSSHQRIKDTINELCGNSNMLLAWFSKVDMDTKYRLFKTLCMFLYGSQHWDVQDKYCEKFFIARCKCTWRLYRLPWQAHSYIFLVLVCTNITVDVQVYVRFKNIFKTCTESNSLCVRPCASLHLMEEGL